MTQSFAESPKGIKAQFKIIKHSIKYLSKQDTPKDILNTQVSIEALYYFQKIISNDTFLKLNKNWKIFHPMSKLHLDKLIVNFWIYISDIFDEIKFPPTQPNQENVLTTTSLNEKRVYAVDFLISITHSLTANQFMNQHLLDFNQSLFNLEIVKPILSILKNQSLHLNLTDKSNSYLFDLLVGILAILLDVSENSTNDKQIWKSLNAESILNNIKGWANSYSVIIDEISMNINNKTLEESLQFINSVNVDEDFIQNEQIYVDLLFMYKLVNKFSFKQQKIFVDLKIRDKFIKILQYFYEIRAKFTYSFKIKYDYPNRQASRDEIKLSIFNYTNLIINNVAFQSIETAVYFNHKEILILFTSFLNDSEFMSKVMTSNPAIVSNIVNNLTILSKYSDMNRKDWLDLNVIDTMNSLINNRYMNIVWYKAVNEKIKTSSLKCLCNLSHGHEITRIITFETYVMSSINYINNFVKLINQNSKSKIVRKEIEFLLDTNEIIMAKTAYYDDAVVINKLNELKRFAVSLKYQKFIYENCNESIKMIIYYGNNIEKLISLKLMSQLCFSKPNLLSLIKDDKFLQFLCLLNQKQANLELKRVIDNILWQLDKFEFPKQDDTNSDSFIVLSYSYSKQKTAIKLKEDLNKLGYKIWLNLNYSMDLAETLNKIQNSSCVIICVCEKYLFNESCQIEANYAYKLDKPLIGLIIQDGSYKFKCWLDQILHNESMILNLPNWSENLISLDSKLTNDLKVNKINKSSFKINSNNQVEKWTQNQVNDWFNQSDIHKNIIKNYANFDGYLLKQLYSIRVETPQFFYQSILNESKSIDETDQKCDIKLADIVYFMDKLEKLFIQ